jgi:predicted metalloprotease with PDZ domain
MNGLTRFRRPAGRSSLLLLLLALTSAALGQQARPARSEPARPSALKYTLSFPQPHTHLYQVEFAIDGVLTPHLDVELPAWTPGSYLVREYARHVRDFSAVDESGAALGWEKIDKDSWRLTVGAAPGRPRNVRVRYRVYARDLTVRTSHLDASHAYFNGASLFMYVKGARDQPHRLKIEAPSHWRVTSPLGLAPGPDGYFTAPNYDILVDSPTEVGTHQLIEFNVLGKPHRIAIWGEGASDPARLKADFTKIIEEGAKIFGGLPYEHYTFIVHLQPGIGGGLEHLNSTTLHASPQVFNSHRGYLGFLGLASHEYFHLWNVKRIRPEPLGPFDYQNENYTRSLWFSEGVTDYYGEQLLLRAGLKKPEEYLESLGSSIRQYESTPGRRVQSAEAASFDAWIKHYRPDENSINTALSYYLKGELLGLLLDFEIRARTSGARTIDDVMRHLNQNYAEKGVGFPDSELKSVFEKIAGADLSDFFARYVSGTAEIDFNHYLGLAGLQLERKYQTIPGEGFEGRPGAGDPGWLGINATASNDRIIIRNVPSGAPAYEGGLNAGDEIVALNGMRVTAENYAALSNALRAGQKVNVAIFRRERLLHFEIAAAKKPFDRYLVTPIKDPSPAQRALRLAWLRDELKEIGGPPRT